MIVRIEYSDALKLLRGECPDGFEILQSGEWVCEDKYPERDIIVQHNNACWKVSFAKVDGDVWTYDYDRDDWNTNGEAAVAKPMRLMMAMTYVDYDPAFVGREG